MASTGNGRYTHAADWYPICRETSFRKVDYKFLKNRNGNNISNSSLTDYVCIVLNRYI